MVSQRRDADAPKDSPKSILESLAGTRVLVVEARYYDDIADELLAGARAAIEAVGAEARVFTVPGALEIPAAIAILMDAGRKAGGPLRCGGGARLRHPRRDRPLRHRRRRERPRADGPFRG
ncbi:protein of unknown function [Methylorubrum extorquens]|uniref:6,7-dimethyl-8-ribityllumazine synthase n=1 Tax=Methylorubrum extorquens TaxID=408 RepID=A0A2N9APA7_METEX|nr:protein of unknown function [Methylorubrum extorquens]